MNLKILKKVTNPYLLLTHIMRHWPFRCVTDEFYLKIFFKAYQGKKLNIDKPITFNEKLQWLKLYDRNPQYTMLSDKYCVREYIKKTIGEEYLIPLLGVWDNAKDIDFTTLPNEFVLKCNHDSGSVIICHNKEKLNIDKTITTLNKSLHKQYFWKSREYNYKNIKPRILAEKLMVDLESNELRDYKYFCFNGEPIFVQVDIGRFSNHIRNFYDMEWNFIQVSYGCRNDENVIIKKPKQHDQMIYLAKILSKGRPHVRVDFYVVNEKVFFGELTFHHGGGAMIVEPKEYDYIWGEYLKLPLKQ